MRSDRGYWAINEVELGMPLTVEMTVLLQARLPNTALHEAVATGRRWVAADLVANKMMEAEAPEAEVLAKAIERAASEAHHAGETLAVMKRQLYPRAYELLVDASS
jgi:enoyl-CoA hydratase/carnithine racemase